MTGGEVYNMLNAASLPPEQVLKITEYGMLKLLLPVIFELILGVSLNFKSKKSGSLCRLEAVWKSCLFIVGGMFFLCVLIIKDAEMSMCIASVTAIILIYASYSDLLTREVDDILWIMLIISGMGDLSTLKLAVIRCGEGLVIMGFCLVIALTARKKGGGLGGADIKMMGALTFTIGVRKAVYALFFGALGAVIAGCLIIRLGHKDKSYSLPLVPFISIFALAELL